MDIFSRSRIAIVSDASQYFRIIALVLTLPAPLLLLLIVLTHALAPLAPILLLLIVPTRVLAPPAPLLLLLIVLTHVLTQLGLCVHCIVAHFLMIAPNSSLQDWHAFPFDKEPFLYSSLVYNQNEDSFKQINSQSDVYDKKYY